MSQNVKVKITAQIYWMFFLITFLLSRCFYSNINQMFYTLVFSYTDREARPSSVRTAPTLRFEDLKRRPATLTFIK